MRVLTALAAVCLGGAALAEGALPFDVGGAFRLVDQTGAERTEEDPGGRHQLLFFGYANCPGICSAALPMMDQVSREVDVVPVMITIDNALDTVETMGPALAKVSDRILGLTGDRAALDVAYDAFRIEFEKVMDDPEHGPIYAHGSFIYLLSPKGEVLTLLPPVLPPAEVARIVKRYLDKG
ncbi:SCO family protein [Roseovarius aestuariivivens]|uniref:SCO family protein n=1 Tax=Roseovarius aestuariivivens TaxID=1888910 RepID=UPI001081CB6F|nr:SCO family protein [Roseovarius aestuariivivens]